ncbi:MAG: hypothetical protein ABI422_02095 [Sphingomicrobium sp.]
MKHTLILALAAGAATLVAAVPADAQNWRNNNRQDNNRHHNNRHDNNRHNNQWRTLAYTTVSGRDTDTIRVPGTTRYRQLRLCVYNAPLTMRDFDVRYRNGGHQDIAVRQVMRAGTCTRNIDLAGNRRDVTKIRLKYAAIRHGWARPLVRVQAR